MPKFTLLLFLWATLVGASSATIVGNSNDGTDLEELTLVTSGRLVTTRDQAAERLRKLRTASVPHLGALLPELQKSRIFIAKKDVVSHHQSDQGMELDAKSSKIYARTFAEFHADTRFFPIALKLSDRQLVTLHIHEALHRALPSPQKTQENVVAHITMAIMSEDATYDRVYRAVRKFIHEPTSHSIEVADERISTMELGYRVYTKDDEDNALLPLKSRINFRTALSPYQNGPNQLDLGVQFAFYNLEEDSLLGPIQLEVAYYRKMSQRLKLGGFLHGSYATLSDNELNDYLGFRDISTAGLQLHYNSSRLYWKTRASVSDSFSREQSVEGVTSRYDFPMISRFSIEVGKAWSRLSVANSLEMSWSDPLKITPTSGATTESERFRIVSMGPKIQYNFDEFSIGAEYLSILNSTKGVNLDELGDTFGSGSGREHFGMNLSYQF